MQSGIKVLLAILPVFLLAGASAALSPNDLLAKVDQEAGTSQELEQIIAQAYGVKSVDQLNGVQVAVIYYSAGVSTDPQVLLSPFDQEPFSGASAPKVVLLVLAARYAETHGWDYKVGSSTLIEVVRKMVSISDNASANTLLKAIKFEGANSWLRSLGFGSDELHFARNFGDFSAAEDNTCTALGLAKFYYLLAQQGEVSKFGNVASLSKARALLDSEGKCNNLAQFNDRLNAKLPDVSFLHKTGSNNDVLADAGIFRGPDYDFILVVLDKTKNKKAMQALGHALYLRFNR